MVTAVGGSGVFSGPTGAQYQQAGVEGLSGALATQRAFAEQQRAQKYKEFYDLAQKEAEARQIPMSVLFRDPGFKDVAKSMLGNTMGGFLGIGGDRRLDQFLGGLEKAYGGQQGEAYTGERAAALQEIVRGPEQVERTLDPGYEQTAAGIMAPPAPPTAGVTPPSAPPAAPASTPAPASTVPTTVLQPVEQVGEYYRNPDGTSGFGPSVPQQFEGPGPQKIVEPANPLGYTLVSMGNAMNYVRALQQTISDPEATAEAKAYARAELAKYPGVAQPGPDQSEAAGQGAGVDAEYQAALKYAKEQRPNDPDFAKVTDMASLRANFPGTMRRYDQSRKTTTTPATSTSTTSAAPVGLEIPQKLGWSSDDIALFRKFYGQNIEDYQSLSGKEQAEYQRYVRLNTQLKNEFTKEVRKGGTEWRAADPNDKSVSTQRALQFIAASDPQGSIASDPRFSHLAENLSQLSVNKVKADIGRLVAAGELDRATAAKYMAEADAAGIMAQADYLKSRSEAIKSTLESGAKVLDPLYNAYQEKVKQKDPNADVWLSKQLADNPWFKQFASTFVSELSKTTGNPVKIETVPVETWKFLFWGGPSKSASMVVTDPYGLPGSQDDVDAETAAGIKRFGNF